MAVPHEFPLVNSSGKNTGFIWFTKLDRSDKRTNVESSLMATAHCVDKWIHTLICAVIALI
jgi:hypothetical protein